MKRIPSDDLVMARLRPHRKRGLRDAFAFWPLALPSVAVLVGLGLQALR